MAVGFLFLLQTEDGRYREGLSNPVGIERRRATRSVIVASGGI